MRLTGCSGLRDLEISYVFLCHALKEHALSHSDNEAEFLVSAIGALCGWPSNPSPVPRNTTTLNCLNIQTDPRPTVRRASLRLCRSNKNKTISQKVRHR